MFVWGELLCSLHINVQGIQYRHSSLLYSTIALNSLASAVYTEEALGDLLVNYDPIESTQSFHAAAIRQKHQDSFKQNVQYKRTERKPCFIF